MSTRRWTALLLGCLLLPGCRAAGMRNALVERDLRQQEDRIYQLQEYIKQYQEMLASCRRENDALRRELGRSDPLAVPPGGEFGPTDTGAPPDVDPGVPFVPPSVDPGPPGESIEPEPMSYEGEEPTPIFSHATAPIAPSPLGGAAPQPQFAEATEPVASLGVNKLLTGGLDIDGQPGDEGVLVVVEPRSAGDQLVRPVGQLSIMLIDPTKPRGEQRVARWDFSADEAAAAWQETLLATGLHFELPWPNRPPTSNRLRLYVRLLTPEGKKLLTDMEIQVDPPAADSSVRPAVALEPAGDTWRTRPIDELKAAADHGWAPTTIPIPVAAKPEPATASQATVPAANRADEPGRQRSPQRSAPRPNWSPHR